MSRSPYQAPMTRSWWMARPDYRVYMLREATALLVLFFAGCLVYGLFRLQQGEAGWHQWLAWMQQPWVSALNALALLATLFHAWTFFGMVPDTIPLRLAGRPVPPPVLIAVQWLAMGVAFLLLWWMLGREP